MKNLGIQFYEGRADDRNHLKEDRLVRTAGSTWQNFMQDPDMSGFRAHVKKVQGVLIFPRLMKGAFVFGLEGGNGVLLVRDQKTGSWSEPAFYEISSASFELQVRMDCWLWLYFCGLGFTALRGG